MNRCFKRLSGPSLFVAGTWLALTAAAFAYVFAFATPLFFADEWDLVGGLTYSEPYLSWLWAQHNEHRLPLPKLVYNVLLNISGFDARAGGVATVTILSGVSLALALCARRMRGSIEYADAFFPVLLLNWGHFEDFLMGFQVSFALSVGLVCVWMISGLGKRHWLNSCLLALPLCGAHGLIYVAPLTLATLWLQRREDFARRLVGLASAVAAACLTVLYFCGYQSPANHPPATAMMASLRIAGEVLALGWGWAGQMTWPASGALSLALIAATVILAGVRLGNSSLRDDVVVVTAVGAGTIALALSIGWGRSGFGPLAGFAVRYALLCVPLMAASYLAWVRLGGPVMESLVPMLLFSTVGLLLTQHARTGLAEGKAHALRQQAFAVDLRSGMAPNELVRRHPSLYPHADRLTERLRVLRAAGVSRYVRPQPVTATAVTDAH